MKKVILFFCILAASIIHTNAQKFMHGAGATIGLTWARLSPNLLPLSATNYYNFSVRQTSATYYPRYNFIENENSSISVGVPLSVGFGLFKTQNSSDAGTAFFYDLPLAVDYNIGFKSTRENPKGFGFFIGLGYGYSSTILSNSRSSDITVNSYGLIYRAGIRIGSTKADWNGKGVMIGFFYKKGSEAEKFSTVGTHVLMDF